MWGDFQPQHHPRDVLTDSWGFTFVGLCARFFEMTLKTNNKRLYWFPYNPIEWGGRYQHLSLPELGLLHRVMAHLWEEPGQTLHIDRLRRRLGIQQGADTDQLLHGLLGEELRVDSGLLVTIPSLAEAFAAAEARAEKAGNGGRAKAAKAAAPAGDGL